MASTAKDAPALIRGWLDGLDLKGALPFLKLMTGALRVGVSARLAKTALAAYGNVDVAEIEEVWHGATPPYEACSPGSMARGRDPRPAPLQCSVH